MNNKISDAFADNSKGAVLLLRQFNSFAILALLAAAGISFWAQANIQSLLIFGIVLASALLRAAREHTAVTDDPMREEFVKTVEAFETAVIGICLLIFILGLMRNIPLFEIFMTSASLAAAPCGLCAAAAITPASGVRRICVNVLHLMTSGCIGAIVLTLTALIMGCAAPLTAAQLLLLSLIIEAFPAAALRFETGDERAVFNRPRAALDGLMIGLLSLLAFSVGSVFANAAAGQTMAFATLGISQLVHSFNLREESLFSVNPFNNKHLVAAFLAGVLIIAAVITIEPVAAVMSMAPLTAAQWLIVTGLCLLPVLITEAEKRVMLAKYNTGKKRQSSKGVPVLR